MIENLLLSEESKTLEFKENTSALIKIIQTIVAFTNTAGGVIVIGVADKTKEIVGLADVLAEEEKIVNALSDSVFPLIIPTIQFCTHQGKELILITIAHSYGPYYIKAKGIDKGTYIRVGSTNRVADTQIIEEIKKLKVNRVFDEQPCVSSKIGDIDFEYAQQLFNKYQKTFTEQSAQSLGVLVSYQEKLFPSNGGLLLFCAHYTDFFPDTTIFLGLFAGTDKSEILDNQELKVPLVSALEPCMHFIRRNTRMAADFSELQRKDVPEYPVTALREVITNALLHADYAAQGSRIQIAIFSDRLEITNPGALPYNLTLDQALNGISQVRNKVIGRVFRELHLTEQWGSGLKRIIASCREHGLRDPLFQELDAFFRVTIFNAPVKTKKRASSKNAREWQEEAVDYVKNHETITPREAQKLWGVTARATSSRLKKMIESKLIVEHASSPFDPTKTFSLNQRKTNSDLAIIKRA